MNSHVLKDKANFHWLATGWKMREIKIVNASRLQYQSLPSIA